MAIRYCGMETKSFWRITAVRATIMARAANLSAHAEAASVAWVGLKSRRHEQVGTWLQMGYANYKKAAIAALEGYVEGRFDGTQYIGAVKPDTEYKFTIKRDEDSGNWWFLLDDLPQGFSAHPLGWHSNEFTYVQLYGEEQHQSELVGSSVKPCTFKNCQVQVAFGDWRDINLHADYESTIDDPWNHLEILAANRFQIYGD
ncbi:MAG TPA: hypothetical protein VNM67_06905 [Thermoanaerobaculia bacterium]|jgi:hypothetical protein|nr:hypothetical protein [Thermoanaerobaculia bacterium]